MGWSGSSDVRMSPMPAAVLSLGLSRSTVLHRQARHRALHSSRRDEHEACRMAAHLASPFAGPFYTVLPPGPQHFPSRRSGEGLQVGWWPADSFWQRAPLKMAWKQLVGVLPWWLLCSVKWRCVGLLTGSNEIHVCNWLLFHCPDGDVQFHVSTPHCCSVIILYFYILNVQESYKKSMSIIQIHKC